MSRRVPRAETGFVWHRLPRQTSPRQEPLRRRL